MNLRAIKAEIPVPRRSGRRDTLPENGEFMNRRRQGSER
jgi:hypothetical protein